MTRRRNRGSRSPGILFCASAAVLLGLIATAFTPAQPPPPPTAEYAPEAAKPIKIAPPQQTSLQGSRAGRGGHGGHGAGGKGGTGGTGGKGGQAGKGQKKSVPSQHTSVPIQTAAPTTFDCAGNLQIPDPESPPCTTTVVKNNGGATWPGVTANEIRIGVPNGSADVPALVNFFNDRFDFYGRKLVVVSGPSCFGAETPAQLRSAADSWAQLKVFAVVGWCDTKGEEYPLYNQLARDHVVSVANRPGWETEAQMAAYDPYEWTFWPTFDVGQSHLGDLACSLGRGPAKYAGAPWSTMPRRVGLFYNTYTYSPSPDIAPILAALQGCGLTPVVSAGIPIDLGGGTGGQGYTQQSAQDIADALIKMRQANVTTLIDLTHADTTKQILQESSAQSYAPEQMISSYLYNDFDLFASEMPADQQSHLFGIQTWNKIVHPWQTPWYYAVNQGDPAFQYTYAAFSYYGVWYDYYPLLVLAAGIQMAGPHLTPASFGYGIQHATYPNPITWAHEGIVSIHPGQHSYISDATIEWFDPSQPNPAYNTSGSFCYFADGARLNVGAYPTDPALFTPLSCPRYS